MCSSLGQIKSLKISGNLIFADLSIVQHKGAEQRYVADIGIADLTLLLFTGPSERSPEIIPGRKLFYIDNTLQRRNGSICVFLVETHRLICNKAYLEHHLTGTTLFDHHPCSRHSITQEPRDRSRRKYPQSIQHIRFRQPFRRW